MKHIVIGAVRRSLLGKNGPTALLKLLKSHSIGRYAIRCMFHYYMRNGRAENIKEFKAMSQLNIQQYHIKQTLVDRLRKSGL